MGKRKQLKRQVKRQQRTIAELERRLDETITQSAAVVRTAAVVIDQMREPS